jgi:secreted PhoX family phosphatase
MGGIIAEQLAPRDLMKGVLAVSALAVTVSPLALLATERACAQGTSTGVNSTPPLNFKEVAAGVDDKHYVAEGNAEARMLATMSWR